MAETNLDFSKIVATPTSTAWSQAYSAGRLFAVISLQTDIIPEEGQEHLTSIGKDLISTLESEFFTLENKDLDSIKQALTTTTGRLKENVKCSLVVCFLSENVLYLFAAGGGKAVLKRGDKIGTVLEADVEQDIKSASGYVQEGDIVILQTKAFLKVIPSSTLASSLDNNTPSEIAENLAPHVHEKTEGGASAVILLYKNGQAENISNETSELAQKEVIENAVGEGTMSSQALSEESSEDEEEANPTEEIKSQTPPTDETEENFPTDSSPFLTDRFPKRKRLSFSFGLGFLKRFPSGISHRRRNILTIAVILIIVITAASFLAFRNKQNTKSQDLFTGVFKEAQGKYEEGQNLKDLNAPLAQESFKSAKQILDENKNKFKNGSSEEKQVLGLLDKVNAEISKATTGESVEAKEAKTTESKILSYELNNSAASYFTQNDDKVFFLDGDGISSVDKGNDKKDQIIKKSWKTEGGIGLFGSNIYVLDTADGILKFVPSEDTYNKTDYFPSDDPDLADSQAMAIDGSVYILFKNGTIDKYTRAKKDSFEVSGLDKQLASPTRIFTNADADNLYVLDNGNSRVVVLDKDGKFKEAYSASVLKKAKDFDVSEIAKKIFILSGGKVYEINIK